MAAIKSLEFGDEILATFSLSQREYDLLKQSEEHLAILPVGSGILNEVLTTGRLGNGNRIMLPTKILKAHNVNTLLKNVPAKIFELDENKFLLIMLEESKSGVPVFEKDEKG
jgi:hypothetical protein